MGSDDSIGMAMRGAELTSTCEYVMRPTPSFASLPILLLLLLLYPTILPCSQRERERASALQFRSSIQSQSSRGGGWGVEKLKGNTGFPQRKQTSNKPPNSDSDSDSAAPMQQRRKSAFAPAPAAAKQSPTRRAGAPLSLAGVFVSIFLVATFLYNEDVVKHATDSPLGGGSGAARARSPDLRVLQEAAHHKVNSRQARSTHDAEEEEVGSKSKEKNKGKEEEEQAAQAQQVVQILDAPISSDGGGGSMNSSTRVKTEKERMRPAAAVRLAEPGCDVYKGWWVYDAEGEQAPLYREGECEFLTEQVTCTRNGRRDDSYQKWRWQPAGCDLPRFDGRLLLERLRNKRLMFVGDSLNRNQWESMVCLVQSVIPPGQKTLTKFVNNGSLNVFRAHEYNATVEFYWAPFLVQSNSDDPQVHSVQDRVIAWRSISKHARNWKGVDYLIFNTYIWWLNTFDIKVLKGARGKYALVDRPIAYRGVLKTWAKWVDRHVDPSKTMVFFMGMSPNHITPEAWGNAGAIKCAMETQPILNQTWPLHIGTDWRLHGVAQAVVRSMRRVAVHLVDITALSELRKDAHTSVHTLRQGRLLTPEQQADPRAYADCIHWCLPGLPDTWNHFLFARIASGPIFPSHR